MTKIIGKAVKITFLIFAATAVLSILINIGMVLAAKKYVYKNIDEIPERTAVLVLGAMTHGTRLSDVLHEQCA